MIELIVIGGSAGALDLMLDIAGALPDALVAPVVMVLHLQANQPSLMPDLLARSCDRQVREVEDKLTMQPRTIYVAPPNYHVLLERDRTLALSVDPPVHWSRPSIDVLFESAADAYGERLMGIVLTGANQDGAAGLLAVKRAGGVTVVQDPQTAQAALMPAAALQRAEPDHVLPLDGIAALLLGLASAPREARP